jgi:hypothetical protein
VTRPRNHPPGAAERVALDGRLIDLADYARLVDAYAAEHPGWTPPRSGIRGDAARLGLQLPDGWARPYLHLLDE